MKSKCGGTKWVKLQKYTFNYLSSIHLFCYSTKRLDTFGLPHQTCAGQQHTQLTLEIAHTLGDMMFYGRHIWGISKRIRRSIE